MSERIVKASCRRPWLPELRAALVALARRRLDGFATIDDLDRMLVRRRIDDPGERITAQQVFPAETWLRLPCVTPALRRRKTLVHVYVLRYRHKAGARG